MSLFHLFRHTLRAEATADGGDAGGAAPADSSAPAGSLLTGDASAPADSAEPAKVEGDNKPADAAKPAGAPEAYTPFTMPEGIEADADLMTGFAATAKELGLSQEQAQKLVDLQVKSAQGQDTSRRESIEQAITKQSEAWVNELKADPELGGEKFNATVATAAKAMQSFGTPELRALLNESGLGNNPELVKLFHRIGASISEDSMVLPGNKAASGRPKPEDIFYAKGN